MYACVHVCMYPSGSKDKSHKVLYTKEHSVSRIWEAEPNGLDTLTVRISIYLFFSIWACASLTLYANPK